MGSLVQNLLSVGQDIPSGSGASSGSASSSSDPGSSFLSVLANPIVGVANTLLSGLFAHQRNKEALAQWKRENEYNLPKNQVSRLLAAGLNPALMYENGASGLISAGSPDIQSAQPALQGVDPLTAAQIDNIRADTALKDSQAKEHGENVTRQRLENFFLDFQKDFLTQNKESIEALAYSQVQQGYASNKEQYYQSVFSGAILASIFGMDESDSYTIDGKTVRTFQFAGQHYDEALHDKFKSLGLSDIEQRQLERALYKSYYEAQTAINTRAKEEANLETVLPEMINKAPDWLKAVLAVLYKWLSSPRSPSFTYSPHSDNSTKNNTNNMDYMINNKK